MIENKEMKVWKDNQVIGYIEETVLVENEDGKWFYFPCEDNYFDIGTVVESELLIPFDSLPLEDQKRLRKKWEQMSLN